MLFPYSVQIKFDGDSLAANGGGGLEGRAAAEGLGGA
jgi:hypothetical protein